MRFPYAVRSGAFALAVTCASCGGSSPSAPSPPGGPARVAIVGNRGAQSFTPNPASVGQDGTIVWRNDDGLVHRIVLNDGSLDTGDIAPGASSRAFQLPAAGTNYHCSIHPSMIGAVNAASGPPPPCTGPYC